MMRFNLQQYKKIGIIGGTFDPIHNQHLYMANNALEKLGLDVIVFMPTGKSPHKKLEFATDKYDRYNMVSLAINDNEKFVISDFETENQRISYTYSTLQYLRTVSRTDAQLYFIMGSDSLNDIYKWRNVDDIAMLCKLVVFLRPDYDENYVTREVIEKYSLDVIFLDDIKLAMSSTVIRKKLYNNENCRYIIPDIVIDYIKKKKLYLQNFTDEYISELKLKVSQKISEKRYKHTLNVMEVSCALAKYYNVNTTKCKVAALLHDFAKEMKKEDMLKYINENNLYIDAYTTENLSLAHGIIASHIAKNEFNIHDIDILNAIEYHTTGRPNMSMIEKIIYLSDALDPSRNYEELENLTELAFADIDNAVLECIIGKIKHTNSEGKVEHPLSIVTFNFYKKELMEKGAKNV